MNQDIKDKILMQALEDVPFDGWCWDVVQNAAEKSGYERDMAMAVFPEKVMDVLAHFSVHIDGVMMAALADVAVEDLRVRERIRLAVQTRLEVMVPYKEAVRAASVYWLVPTRKVQAAKQVWQSADVIWNWAGDTAQDYNHYTKRALLSGVMTSTILVWLNDKSDGHQESLAFLDRRIDDVLKVGKISGQVLGPVLGLFGNFRKRKETGHA